jgi:hypothetical protein
MTNVKRFALMVAVGAMTASGMIVQAAVAGVRWK